MFGAVGQPRPRRVGADHPPGPRRRHQLHRHRRRVLRRRVRGDRRQGARRHRPRRVVLATKVHAPMGDDPNQQGNSRRWIIAEVREQPAPARHRPPRPLPGAPPRPDRRRRRDAGRADRPGARRQDPLLRQLHLPGPRDRRGAVGGRAPGPRALRHRAAAVLDAGAGHRGRRAARRRAVRHGRAAVEPARRRLAVGCLRVGQGQHQPPRQPGARSLRPVAPREPAQGRGRRPARRRGRRGRAHAHPARHRLRARAPGGHLADHRPAHGGAPRVAARRPPT